MTDRLNELKGEILKDPALILDDPDVMRALLISDDEAKGQNVVDLRGAFVARLEERLNRLEDTHRTVIAAAYDNLAGTNQIHRAILSLLDAETFDDFLLAMKKDTANILAVDVIRLCLESDKADGGTAIGPEGPLKETVVALPVNGVSAYITGGRNRAAPQVTLRAASNAKDAIFGASNVVQSEAILRLDLGSNGPQGLVVFGSTDPNRFAADQGTELLAFFAQTVERMLRRWVA
ncbi:MAG: DUF484 family protein [Rhodobacteraceae bacterium]|nr:DUF484 family protein [Paracoccaceae bacterium]